MIAIARPRHRRVTETALQGRLVALASALIALGDGAVWNSGMHGR